MEEKRVLITKLASMGDLIHLLPALTDAKKANPALVFDWIVDKNFAEVASWHPAVEKTILTNHRKWRSSLTTQTTRLEIKSFLKNLKQQSYDLVIDAQGNIKSAFISLFAKGPRAGFDASSIPEWGAHFLYHKTASAEKNLHAIEKLRLLVASALDYDKPNTPPDYNINKDLFINPNIPLQDPYLLFVPLASHPSKLWSEAYWIELIKHALPLGLPILIPSGNDKEQERAKRLATLSPHVIALPKLPLSQIGYLIEKAKAVISLDTGLSHIAAALSTPCLTLYGPTDPKLTGTIGLNQSHIHAPLTEITPKEVHQGLMKLLLAPAKSS